MTLAAYHEGATWVLALPKTQFAWENYLGLRGSQARGCLWQRNLTNPIVKAQPNPTYCDSPTLTWCMMFYDLQFCSVLWCWMKIYDDVGCCMMLYDDVWCFMMLYDVMWCWMMMMYDVVQWRMMFYDVARCCIMVYSFVVYVVRG